METNEEIEKHKLQHRNGLVSVSTLCHVASEIKIAMKNNLGLNHNGRNVDTMNEISARKTICKGLYCGT